MRFKILAAAVMVSTVGVATAASAAHHKAAVGHRHHAPAAVAAKASNSPPVMAMPLPLRPVAPRQASARSKSAPGPRTASGAAPAAAGTGGAPAAVGTGGRADRSGGRAASF
jgi:hypothetical protein